MLHVKYIIVHRDEYAAARDEGGYLEPTMKGMRATKNVTLCKSSEIWVAVCRPTEERLRLLESSLHDALTDATITLKVWRETWFYRSLFVGILDAYACVNVDAATYMKRIRKHVGGDGMVKKMKGKNQVSGRRRAYKQKVAEIMCQAEDVWMLIVVPCCGVSGDTTTPG